MVQVMSYHPEYLECFLKTQQYMLRSDGPLPYDYRHYIAIMVSTQATWPSLWLTTRAPWLPCECRVQEPYGQAALHWRRIEYTIRWVQNYVIAIGAGHNTDSLIDGVRQVYGYIQDSLGCFHKPPVPWLNFWVTSDHIKGCTLYTYLYKWYNYVELSPVSNRQRVKLGSFEPAVISHTIVTLKANCELRVVTFG